MPPQYAGAGGKDRPGLRARKSRPDEKRAEPYSGGRRETQSPTAKTLKAGREPTSSSIPHYRGRIDVSSSGLPPWASRGIVLIVCSRWIPPLSTFSAAPGPFGGFVSVVLLCARDQPCRIWSHGIV